MASLLQACVVLLLLSCVHGQGSVYFSQLVTQCVSGTTSTQLTACSTEYSRVAVSTGDFICSNIDALVNYNGCSRRALLSCIPSQYHGLFQTDEGLRDSYQYYCDHRTEISSTCYSTALGTNNCGNNALTSYSNAINQTGLVQATCSYMEALRTCIYTNGASCPNHNRDVADTYWRKSYPPACGGMRSTSVSLLLLAACTALVSKMSTVLWF